MRVDGQGQEPAALPHPHPPGMTPGTQCTRGWVGSPICPDWTGAENLATSEIRSTDRPARTESLYTDLGYPKRNG